MKFNLIFCEGLREVRFVQSVIGFYLKFELLTKEDEKAKVEEELKDLISKLLGRVESIYKDDDRYYVIINMQSQLSKLLEDKSLIDAYKDLEEKTKLIFVADREYESLKDYFDNCLIFDNKIEDFILKTIQSLGIKIDESLMNTLIDACKKYNDKVDDKKVKVQLFHLILSAGECDMKMFAKIFKLSEGLTIREVKQLKNLLDL